MRAANMVPRANAVGHYPALTAFTGRVPSYKTDAPYAFGQAGLLQEAQGPSSNSAAAPRGDYCVWIGTTQNITGTHRCLNIGTFREITRDTSRPTLLTTDFGLTQHTVYGIPVYGVTVYGITFCSIQS